MGGVSNRCVVHAQVVADSPDDHGSGVDADPQPEIDSQLALDFAAVSGDGVLNGKGGIHGAEPVILERDGGAEERHEPVAEELVHGSLVSVDGLGHEPQHAVHDLVHRLRLEPGRELGGIDEIAEEDADLLPFPLHGRSRGEDPLREVLRGVRVGRRGWRLGEGLAAAATEALVGLVGEAARGAEAGQRRAAGPAESATVAVIGFAARALHSAENLLPGSARVKALCYVSRMMRTSSDASLRVSVAADLPPAAFVRRPLRILLLFPLVAFIGGASALLLVPALPWYALVGILLALANAYVALMFFGHEVAHGATVRSERLQDAVLWVSCAIFLVSSHLWRHWHNRLHHGRTNMPSADPDLYDLVENLAHVPPFVRWLTTRFAPGSGRWPSALYLFVAFTVHGQVVLWLYSRDQQFGGFRWARALSETAAVAAWWVALALMIGPRGTLLVIVIPMLLANAIVMAYITTNHMLRSLTDAPDCLVTTMSVTTVRAIDTIHLHFSHHVEHHLFPAMSHRYYPLVRRSLRRHAAGRYLAPAHWRALLTLYQTPRHYATYDELINPLTGRRLPLSTVEARLRDMGREPQDR